MEIGVDIVEHERVKKTIANKILTSKEKLQLDEIKNEQAKIEYVASRFAAKEAVIKATNKKYSFQEIEVLKTGNKPSCNIANIKLSISHEKKYSIAFCIYLGENNE
ncbi:MAG: holo-ACP synthase [Mycoplasmatales bacterium]